MRREAFASFAVVALIALLAAPGVRAEALTVGPILACEYITPTGQVDRFWIDEEGVSHWRHLYWESKIYAMDGSFMGDNAGWEDRNLDANGNGDKLGYFDGLGFTGHYGGTYVNGIAYVSFVGHGPDNQLFYGSILEPSSACPNNGNLAEAYLLMPHA